MDPSRPISPSTDTADDSHDFETVDLDIGTTAPGVLVPRERFSFWCFDLLFLICSNVTSGKFISLRPFPELIILLDQERELLHYVCRPCSIDAKLQW
ncbi:hypothetical protein DFH29DRAFT_395632 [Suillus ampliporus]|nr:hypothetical protein DFH29DRAFT_395632 [Suillus ampliporus]